MCRWLKCIGRWSLGENRALAAVAIESLEKVQEDLTAIVKEVDQQVKTTAAVCKDAVNQTATTAQGAVSDIRDHKAVRPLISTNYSDTGLPTVETKAFPEKTESKSTENQYPTLWQPVATDLI